MKSIHRRTCRTLAITALLSAPSLAAAQTATVDLNAQKQYIRGFGGMVHIPWAGDLSASERTLAFGNADGQLGFTILRIAVPDGNTSVSSYVATAKAAIAAGGLVYASPWNSSGNMNSSEFASYADHLSSFVSYMKSQGVDLYAISVQNEPDYGAQSGWRAWTAAQCHDFVLNYGDKVGTRLMSCESFNYAKGFYDPILNDSAALDKLGVLGTHLYGTSVNGFPYPLFDQKAAGKVERWMTEHYTTSDRDANLWPDALNVATELHNSMVEAQFNAYTWWYIKRSYGPINNGVTKRGWCMAHWSKFVRPGYYRVDATKSPTNSVKLSAFKGPSDVVLVAVNTGSSSASLDVTIQGSSIASYDRFTTSSDKSFAKEAAVQASNGSLSVMLDAQSVTTLYGTGDVPVGTGGSAGAGGSMGTGGSTGTGGSSAATGGRGPVGGRSASGGSVATGGSGPAGGRSSSGGRSAFGGSSATGGTEPTDTGGTPASGGTSATGGAARPAGGTMSGGSVAGGQPGTGGTAAGGVPTSGGIVGAGGRAASAGMTGTDASSDESGCGCRASGGRSSSNPLVLGWLGLLAFRSPRRRNGSSR